MTKRMSAVLIGCGRWGRVLLKSAMSIGIEIVGLIDTDDLRLARAVKMVKPYSARPLVTNSTFDELLTTVSADAVIIATPPTTHAEMAQWYLNRGLHVYCEKPLVMDWEELAMLVVPDGLVLQVGYQYAHMMVIGDLYIVGQGPVNVGGFWHNDGQVRDDIGGNLNTLVHPASMLVSLLWDEWVGVKEVVERSYRLPGQAKAGVWTVAGVIETSLGDVSYLFDTSWMAKEKRREFRVSMPNNEFVFDDVAKTLVMHDTVDMSHFEQYHWSRSPVENALNEFRVAVMGGASPMFPEPLFTRRIFECLSM